VLSVSLAKREEYGSVVIAVLTHGERGGQIAAKDGFYSALELRTPFHGNSAYQGKPKVFLQQVREKLGR
jgi:hypothetical protein